MALSTIVLLTFLAVSTATIFGEAENNHFPRFMQRNPSPFNPFAFLNIARPQMRNFPFMPVMPNIQMPTEDEILHIKPKPGQSYSAVYASSKNGKGKVAFNVDGHVFKEEFSHKDPPGKSGKKH